MKVKVIKKGMERFCQQEELELLKSAGWVEAQTGQIKSVEEPLVLKPPVKSKGTAKQTLDNAIQQGDE